MIPRRMSFFWAGGAMSWMRYMTIYSFRKLNPDWEIILYTLPTPSPGRWIVGYNDATYRGKDHLPLVEPMGVKIQEWDPPIKNLAPAHASGLSVWDILSTSGGWCADMDILFIRPMSDNQNSPLCRVVKTDVADVVLCNTMGMYVATAFLGSAPGSPLFAEVYRAALENYSPKIYQCVGPLSIYKACGLIRTWNRSLANPGNACIEILRDRYQALRIVQLPDVTVYPWNFLEMDGVFQTVLYVGEETIGIHWFGGRRELQMWNTVLNEDTYRDAEVTFTHYAKKILDA